MNKLALSAVATAVLGFAALAPRGAAAVDGTITINGQVIAQTCKVDNNGIGAQDSVTVHLPSVLAPALSAPGSVAGTTPFSIAISGCDSALQTVQTSFSGVNIDSTTGALLNTASSNGVEVRLLDDGANPIALSNNYTAPAVSLHGGGATLQYAAQYYAKQGNVTAGQVSTSVAFTLSYQ